MKEPIDKKNFCVNGQEYTVVYARRVYIEWYIVKGTTRIRKKIYAGINRYTTKEDQLHFAISYIHKLRMEPLVVKSVLLQTLEDYINTMRHSTFLSYRVRVNIFIKYLKQIGVDEMDVTPEVAKCFLLHLLNIGRSNTTVKSYVHSLSALYKRIGEYNPFEQGIKLKVNKVSLMYYNTAQVKAILDYCRSNDLAYMILAIKLLYTCYIRPKEMRFLQMKHIDFENGLIEMTPDVSKNGKHQKVIIPDTLLSEIQYLKNYASDLYVFGVSKIGSVKPVGNNYFNLKHRAILKELKISGRYAFYSWKHTGVMQAVKAGINLKDLQMQLRHHSLDMVNEYLKNLGVTDSDDLRTKQPTL